MGTPSKKHHYIPAFYLKRWASEDGQVCEFSRPRQNVVPQRRHPNATGYRDRLYSIVGLPDDAAHFYEDAFFKPVDTKADLALRHLETMGGADGWTASLRSAWSKFLHSLLLRCPEDIEKFITLWLEDTIGDPTGEWEARYREIRKPDQPATMREYMQGLPQATHYRSAFKTLTNLIDGKGIGLHMNNMSWGVLDLNGPKHSLLTSDRPIVRTNGLSRPGGHLALALGPKRLFVAAKNQDVLTEISRTPHRTLALNYNTQVVEGAAKYVWGDNDRQLRFIENRMSCAPSGSLVDQLRGSRPVLPPHDNPLLVK